MTTETTNLEQGVEQAPPAEAPQQPSVRDALEAAYVQTIEKPEQEAKAQTAPKDDAARQRDEAGRFAPKKEDAKPADAAPTAQAKTEKLGIKRPDSWKKELWPIWDKLDAGEPLTREEQKQFLEYIPHRESEYQRGVSTYKQEWENAKPLIEALVPYQGFLRQANLKPEQYVSMLAQTEQQLRFGTPQQKLAAFVKFAQDYQVPMQEMFVRGEDGQIYFNQQHLQAAQQAQQQGLTRNDVQAMLAQERVAAMVQQFQSSKGSDGKPLYPYFNEVRQTMDGLLRSGLATDLHGAYEAALKLPQHQALYDAQQTAKREAEEAEKKREAAEVAARARSNTVSTKTTSPTGPVGGNGKANLRAQLEEAYDKHVGGRI